MSGAFVFVAAASMVICAAVFNTLPPGHPFLGVLAIGLALLWLGSRRPKALAVSAAVISGLALATILSPLPELVTDRLRQDCSQGPADAVVALEGDAGQDRIIQAVRLFSHKRAGLLVVTGSSSVPDGWRYYETATLLGLRDDQLRRVQVTQPGTHGEALALHNDPVGRRLRRLILVTSPAHSSRAVTVFRRVGYEACADATPVRRGVDPWGRIGLARDIVHEAAAWAYYSMRRWV